MSNDIHTTPRKITLQAIFDAAWEAFIVNDNPPAVEYDYCAYCTTDGRRCAIGLAMTDEQLAIVKEFIEQQVNSNQQPGIDTIIKLYHEWFDLSCAATRGAAASKFRYAQISLHDGLLDLNTSKFLSKDIRIKSYLNFANIFGLTVPANAESITSVDSPNLEAGK